MQRRTDEEWQQLFSEHTQSGQSAAVFCRERGLCARHFSKRRKQLQMPTAMPPPTTARTSAFIPVRVTPTLSAPVEIQWHTGMVLRVPASVSTTWLAELLRKLRG